MNPFARGDQTDAWLAPLHVVDDLAWPHAFHPSLTDEFDTAANFFHFPLTTHSSRDTVLAGVEAVFRQHPFWEQSGPLPLLLCGHAHDRAHSPFSLTAGWQTEGPLPATAANRLKPWAPRGHQTASLAQAQPAPVPSERFRTAFGGADGPALLGMEARRGPGHALPFP